MEGRCLAVLPQLLYLQCEGNPHGSHGRSPVSQCLDKIALGLDRQDPLRPQHSMYYHRLLMYAPGPLVHATSGTAAPRVQAHSEAHSEALPPTEKASHPDSVRRSGCLHCVAKLAIVKGPQRQLVVDHANLDTTQQGAGQQTGGGGRLKSGCLTERCKRLHPLAACGRKPPCVCHLEAILAGAGRGIKEGSTRDCCHRDKNQSNTLAH